jgi:hypothetical protein
VLIVLGLILGPLAWTAATVSAQPLLAGDPPTAWFLLAPAAVAEIGVREDALLASALGGAVAALIYAMLRRGRRV